ncbi:hypothetical protein ACHJH3_06325 [Campylobacter sp. MOP7]|uniref:hypothetical protein n=1 Tax=Campylobacter canis TaxID=3378588 RepID=UPI00387E563B
MCENIKKLEVLSSDALGLAKKAKQLIEEQIRVDAFYKITSPDLQKKVEDRCGGKPTKITNVLYVDEWVETAELYVDTMVFFNAATGKSATLLMFCDGFSIEWDDKEDFEDKKERLKSFIPNLILEDRGDIVDELDVEWRDKSHSALSLFNKIEINEISMLELAKALNYLHI